MARPLRIEFPGAIYHITSRRDGRENIYLDEDDRYLWLNIFRSVCKRMQWKCHTYCLMTNHYHLVIETPEPNLSAGMRQLNGVYTQSFNRRHGRVGHVFQGRYKAVLVDKESYLLELCRYVVLNPVRARVVRSVVDWKWSSFRAMVGEEIRVEWVEVDWILGQFGSSRQEAILNFIDFVQQGLESPSVWNDVRKQIYLGTEQYIKRIQDLIGDEEDLSEIPIEQRRPVKLTIESYYEMSKDKKEAMAQAYLYGRYTMKEIGKYFGVHYSTVSRAVRSYENL